MDLIIDETMKNFNTIPSITLLELLVSLILSVILSVLTAKAYMMTHTGYSYSKTYIQSLVLITATITLIMVIIGSNVARAFALVGAMSIVRFRNPIKDSRDLVFIFIAMAIGMACGTQFYLFAILFTLLVIGLLVVFELTSFGQLKVNSYVLKVRTEKNKTQELQEYIQNNSLRYSLVSIESADDNISETIYEVSLKNQKRYEDLLIKMKKHDFVISVQLLVGEGSVNV